MAALTTDLRDRVDHSFAARLRERFPEVLDAAPEPDLLAFIRRVRSTAKSYRIDREDDIATFADLSIMYGEQFHNDAWAADALQQTLLHGPDRMALLRHKVRLTNVAL